MVVTGWVAAILERYSKGDSWTEAIIKGTTETAAGLVVGAIGGALGMACGPVAWLCVPAGSIIGQQAGSQGMAWLFDNGGKSSAPPMWGPGEMAGP